MTTNGPGIAYTISGSQLSWAYPNSKNQMEAPEGTRFIPVGESVILVDECDAGRVMEHKWHMANGRASANIDGKSVSIGAFILGKKPGFVVDHINRVSADNRRCNLRYATKQQNAQNRTKAERGSMPKGVVRGNLGGYLAIIKHKGKRINLGMYGTSSEAARVYDEAAKAIFGEFAAPNESMQDHLLNPVTLASST